MDDIKNYVSLAVHKEFADRMDSENERLSERLDSMEKTFNNIVVTQMSSMNASIERMLFQIESILKTQEDHGKRISKIEDRDGEQWRSIVGHLITAGVGAFVSFIMMKVGLS